MAEGAVSMRMMNVSSAIIRSLASRALMIALTFEALVSMREGCALDDDYLQSDVSFRRDNTCVDLGRRQGPNKLRRVLFPNGQWHYCCMILLVRLCLLRLLAKACLPIVHGAFPSPPSVSRSTVNNCGGYTRMKYGRHCLSALLFKSYAMICFEM